MCNETTQLIAARNTLSAAFVDAARNGRPEQANNIGEQIDIVDARIAVLELRFSRTEPRYLVEFADGSFVGGFVLNTMSNERLRVERSEAVQFGSFQWAELIRENLVDDATAKSRIELVKNPGGICIRCAIFCELHELDESNVCDGCC